ncbi:MAG: methylated-DNA--[protein]-cysteine S-methyltransferase [Bacteroidota bacterium]|nr:methylated-DNA--[protein]-cysteine S-methyltransferase [Bacteroidota bacterium]
MSPASHRTTLVEVTASRHESPLGTLHLLSVGQVFIAIAFDMGERETGMEHFLTEYVGNWTIKEESGKHDRARRELDEYFSGRRRRFSFRLHLYGTAFQVQVWTAIRTIPYGTTATYRTVAEMIGNPGATRAVGQALGRNPLPIVVPCHRVIGENGKLVGYAGGVERKKRLLQIEGSLLV